MANELINTGKDFVELKPDGTYVRHSIQFSQAGTHIIKLTKDAQGKETPAFIIPKRMVKLDTAGEILEEKKGFDMDSEIVGPPADYVHINESDIPADYEIDDPDKPGKKKKQYKYNKSTKKLVKRS